MITIKGFMKMNRLPFSFQRRNKKSYFSWFASYIILIALFILSITLMTIWAKAILKTEIINANKASFNTISANINSVKTDLDRLAFAIASNEAILYFTENGQPVSAEDFYNINEIKSDFRNYWNTYDYISEICILNHHTQQIIINGGLVDARDIYESYRVSDKTEAPQSYDDWKSFMQENHQQALYRTDSGLILYVQSIPYSIYGQPAGTMLLVIDKWKFSSLLSDDSFQEGKSFLLLNHKNDLIFELGKDYFFEHTDTEEWNRFLSEDSLPGVELIRSQARGKLNTVMLIADRVFWKPLNQMYFAILSLTAVLIIMGILLSLKFTKKHYSPVKALVQLVSQQKQASPADISEYDFIRTYITDSLRSLKNSRRLEQQYKEEALNREFADFLKSKASSDSLSDIFKRFQIDFTHCNYLSILISITDFSDYISSAEFDLYQEQALLKLAITNILSELIGPEYQILSFSLDNNMLFCLAGWNSPQDDPELRTHIITAQKLTMEKAGIHYTAAVSGIYHTLSGAFPAYLQTIDVQAYGKNTNSDILFYEEINWSSQGYEFTPDLERELLDLIYSGKEQEIRLFLERLCAMPFPQADIIQKITRLKYDLVSVCLKAMQEKNVEAGPDILALLSDIDRCQTLGVFQSHMLKLLNNICQICKAPKSQLEQKPLPLQIMEYVGLHYNNPELNVNMLGQLYNLTPSYLSKLFKDNTGQMLRSYIIETRLKNAQILLNSPLKIDIVAQKCGFADSGSFIRAFKKHFGMTPGKYRELIQKPLEEN